VGQESPGMASRGRTHGHRLKLIWELNLNDIFNDGRWQHQGQRPDMLRMIVYDHDLEGL
jgi:hypothetical protein